MDEEDKHSPSEFYYPEDLETFEAETETGITECHIINYLPYRKILALGRFRTDLAELGPYCHDLGPIFPSTTLALG